MTPLTCRDIENIFKHLAWRIHHNGEGGHVVNQEEDLCSYFHLSMNIYKRHKTTRRSYRSVAEYVHDAGLDQVSQQPPAGRHHRHVDQEED